MDKCSVNKYLRKNIDAPTSFLNIWLVPFENSIPRLDPLTINKWADTHVIRKLYIGWILCLDTCLYHLIHRYQSNVRLLLFVVSRCETAKLCPKTDSSPLVNSIIFRPFFLSLRPMSIVSYKFCPVPTCAFHVFCTLFSCLSIDSSLYHVIFSHVTVLSVFFGKVKVEFVTLRANFDYLYLN